MFESLLREEQRKFANWLEKLFSQKKEETGNVAIAEAWTGFGKTRSILAGAIETLLKKHAKIIISCATKEQQHHFFQELKTFLDEERNLNRLLTLVGPYSAFFQKEVTSSQLLPQTPIKCLILKGKTNYLIREKLFENLKKIKDKDLIPHFIALADLAFGDIEVMELIDSTLFSKMKDCLNLEEITASTYLSIRDLDEKEYLKKIRLLFNESNLIICNHYIALLYMNLMHRTFTSEEKTILFKKADFLLPVKNGFPLSYSDYLIFDEAHKLPQVYLHISSKSRTLRKALFYPLEEDLREKHKLTKVLEEIRKLRDRIADNAYFEDIIPVGRLDLEVIALLREAVELNIRCVRTYVQSFELKKTKEEEKREAEEDLKFFEEIKKQLRLLNGKRGYSSTVPRLFLGYSEDKGYPSLYYAPYLRGFYKRANFRTMVFVSATLSATREIKESLLRGLQDERYVQTHRITLYDRLNFYTLSTLGIKGQAVKDIKIFVPHNFKNKIRVICYTDTYPADLSFAETKETTAFTKALKEKYLNVILPEIKKVLKEELDQETCKKVILLGKSYEETAYLRDNLSEFTHFMIYHRGGDNFTETLQKFRNLEKGLLILTGRYEGFDLPELSTLLLTRIPFVSYELLYLMHGIEEKSILNNYNQKEAIIALKQILGRLMRGTVEKKLYIFDSRITRFMSLFESKLYRKICQLEIRQLSGKEVKL